MEKGCGDHWTRSRRNGFASDSWYGERQAVASTTQQGHLGKAWHAQIQECGLVDWTRYVHVSGIFRGVCIACFVVLVLSLLWVD